MKMKSVKAVLILLLLIAGMVTGYLLWKMKEPDYEKERLFVDNGVVAYYNMTETGVAAYASAPASVLIEEEEGQSEAL